MDQFLQERNEYPDRADEIDAEIKQVFGETLAILIFDMSGFSRQTIRYGIIHFLAQIHRMHSVAMPIVKAHAGEVIKREADNLFAVFPEVDQAVAAAVDLDTSFQSANTMLSDEYDVHGEYGIGFGEILVIENEDIFGAEVNLASKLGEDLAQRGEILLTEAAYKNIHNGTLEYEQLRMSVSGLELVVYKVKKDGLPTKA